MDVEDTCSCNRNESLINALFHAQNRFKDSTYHKLSLLTNFVYCLKRSEMLPQNSWKRQSNNPATQDKVLIILKPMQSLN